MSDANESIAWNYVIKKEARGATYDSDFGDDTTSRHEALPWVTPDRLLLVLMTITLFALIKQMIRYKYS